jgi:hypothetical protein
MAAYQHMPVAVGDCVCATAWRMSKLPEDLHSARAPWEGRRRGLTQEFEAFALTLMREMPVKKAGEILGETDQKLWRARSPMWTRRGKF